MEDSSTWLASRQLVEGVHSRDQINRSLSSKSFAIQLLGYQSRPIQTIRRPTSSPSSWAPFPNSRHEIAKVNSCKGGYSLLLREGAGKAASEQGSGCMSFACCDADVDRFITTAPSRFGSGIDRRAVFECVVSAGQRCASAAAESRRVNDD
ncbi:hypothetical protein VTH06DRAFT_7233 [Thermothelomyces fergusii]